MLESMGIDFDKIQEMAQGVGENVKGILEALTRIENKQDEILATQMLILEKLEDHHKIKIEANGTEIEANEAVIELEG